MEIQHIVSNERARQEIYKALVSCYHLPETTLVETLSCLHQNMKFIESNALPHIDEILNEIQGHDIDFLSVEFARLFVGPYSLPVPPYGSIYLENERKVMGDSTMDVLRHYRKFDLDMTGGLKEAPDHIMVELEFMFFLICKEIESILSDDPESAQVYFTEQACFITAHLCDWVPQYCPFGKGM